MKKILLILSTFAFTVGLTACSGSSQSQEKSSKTSTTTVEKPSSSTITSPCQLITEKDVRQRFAIPDSIKLDQQDKVLTYPSCIYKWKGGLTQTKKIGGKDYTIDVKSELFIVMYKGAKAKDYEASIKVYTDGQPVEGIGQKATWSDQRSQLSFFVEGYLFHITVEAYEDNAKNKEKAMSLAKEIIGEL